MSENLKNCLEILKLISSVKSPILRRRLLTDYKDTDNVYNALREISHNILKKNIKLTTGQQKKLSKYSRIIEKLAKKQKTKAARKKLLIQSGGFLPILIPTVISVLSEILRNGTFKQG